MRSSGSMRIHSITLFALSMSFACSGGAPAPGPDGSSPGTDAGPRADAGPPGPMELRVAPQALTLAPSAAKD